MDDTISDSPARRLLERHGDAEACNTNASGDNIIIKLTTFIQFSSMKQLRSRSKLFNACGTGTGSVVTNINTCIGRGTTVKLVDSYANTERCIKF